MRTIPFDYQPISSLQRMCGASCAVMMLSHFGQDTDRDKIWRQIRSKGRSGTYQTRTYKLADYLISRELSVLIVRAKDPLELLHRTEQASSHAIVCCRPQEEATYGHFMVFVGTSADEVAVHDPERGANRTIPKQMVNRLFEPRNTEITPRIVMLVNDKRQHAASCQTCAQDFPEQATCPHCSHRFAVDFSGVLGCADTSCANAHWESIICSKCDRDIHQLHPVAHAVEHA